MANVLTLSDLRAALPDVQLSETTTPTAAQADALIGNVEQDVQALLVGYGAGWPASAADPTWAYLRQTVLEGAKEQVLRARYAMTPGDLVPDELARAADAYKDRTSVARLGRVATAIRASMAAPATGAVPMVAAQTSMPRLGGSLNQYTQERDYAASALDGGPWPAWWRPR